MKRALKRVAIKMAQSKKVIVGATVVGASTASFADATPLDTALDGVTTAAVTGLSSIQSHSATVIAAVFGVVLLFAGARHLFSASKAK